MGHGLDEWYLEYFKENTPDRIRDYHKLTFSMHYFYSEKFLMPFSHDEVVHGKATILQKMNGSYDDKFPQARALYMYMYAHPGKNWILWVMKMDSSHEHFDILQDTGRKVLRLIDSKDEGLLFFPVKVEVFLMKILFESACKTGNFFLS